MNPVRNNNINNTVLKRYANSLMVSRISNGVKFYLNTNHPLALDSYEYRYPMPKKHVKYNSRNINFNARLPKSASVLDLGCGGGGFIKDCTDEGRLAVGLEGTDRYRKAGWAEWATIPEYLFTCDITKSFILHLGDEKPYQFDVITAWEVMEHIPKSRLNQLLKNITNHLKTNGVFIASISNKTSINPKYNIDMHRIHKDLDWWLGKFNKANLIRDKKKESHFDNQWIRNERKSYHLVLRKKN
ncbi:hypothetical protein A2865_00380 [Candidatus Woesebacteria bacterium RIFCSPHIGHO2_01_FULL_39_17]|nr:MAG: hypothetical protein A2865_00380 [Candidatus Woesebacteria bacterium RIFCSPHIGHO2_01_FULL_39_17]